MHHTLHFELRLEERLEDRVFISVVLAPKTPEGTSVDGVSVQMVDRSGESLGPRIVLPLSGAVAQPLVTTVEVRARGSVPTGARVVGAAWRDNDQLDASCPCDPGTQLEVHMRGRRVIPVPPHDGVMRPLEPEERAKIARLMPWVDEPMVLRPNSGVLESPEPTNEEMIDDVAEQFDLDEEDAAFLKELLEEDDEL